MTEKPEISVVVPLLNEEESLRELAAEVKTALEQEGYTFEVIFVDDGSRDGSWKVIRTLNAEDSRFKALKFNRNYGKSAALAVGFRQTRGRYVVTIDADLQDDPAEIPGLIEKLKEGYDLVSGWKQNRQDPFIKRTTSKLFNRVTRFFSGIRLHDFNCGLKAYRSEVVHRIYLYGEMHRYIPLIAKWEGFDQISEKKVHHRARKYGKTKFGMERFIRGFLDLISVGFLTRFAARPMHFFGTLGTLSFFGGLLINLYLTALKLVGQPIGRRPLLFLGMLLIILGAQLFLTGLLGEMIIRPRMENPESYVISDRLGGHRTDAATERLDK